MGSGGWKRVAVDSNKERFVQKKDFWFVKMGIFADSRLRAVGRGGGGQKRIALDGNKERFVQKNGFWFVKMGKFCGQRRKARAKEIFCA